MGDQLIYIPMQSLSDALAHAMCYRNLADVSGRSSVERRRNSSRDDIERERKKEKGERDDSRGLIRETEHASRIRSSS